MCIGCRCYLLWARAHTHTSTNVIVYEKQLVDEYWCVLAGCIPSEFATWAVTKRRRRKKKRLYVKKIDSCVGWTETTKTSVAEFRVKRFHHSDALKRRCNLSCSYAAMRHNSTHSNTTLSIHTRGFFFCFSFLCIITRSCSIIQFIDDNFSSCHTSKLFSDFWRRMIVHYDNWCFVHKKVLRFEISRCEWRKMKIYNIRNDGKRMAWLKSHDFYFSISFQPVSTQQIYHIGV